MSNDRITIWLHEPTLMMWKLECFPNRKIEFMKKLRAFHAVHHESLPLNYAMILMEFYWEQWSKE